LGKKPKNNDGAQDATAKKINGVLLLGAVLLMAGIVWYTLQPAPKTLDTASLPKPSTTTLSPDQFSGKTKDAYQVAKEIPEVLNQIPCYCGCMQNFGHRSNLDCFHDHHGIECTMCQDIALDAYDMYKKGFTIERIRENIQRTHGKLASVTH
jgi:hypothetical protein